MLIKRRLRKKSYLMFRSHYQLCLGIWLNWWTGYWSDKLFSKARRWQLTGRVS